MTTIFVPPNIYTNSTKQKHLASGSLFDFAYAKGKTQPNNQIENKFNLKTCAVFPANTLSRKNLPIVAR